MAPVSFDGVSKRFGTVEAVRELTLAIADGELMVLVGPSGSGKTTALRMLAGLEAVDAGRIEIGSRVVNDVSPRDRDVAMVFQDYALYPQMTVRDNMAFGLRRRGLERSEVDRRVTETCATLGLGDLLDRRPRQLSGVEVGQRLVEQQYLRLAHQRAAERDPLLLAARASSRAASSSGSRSAARWCASRRYCCSTSRCPTSTPSCACRRAARSSGCRAMSARRWSTSRTTRPRRSRSATGSR
jgi:ABC-type Fe3+/spermidine/putrescine transport system ATPase subunit